MQIANVGVAGTVVNGTLNGSNVAFDLDTQDAHHTGAISGRSMSGQANYKLDLGQGPVLMTGSWSASH